MQEMIELLDANRRPTGKLVPRGTTLLPGEYILVVHACIYNRAGELLIQQRSAQKKSYPGYWDVSAAGGVRVGETGRECAIRETREELGLDVDLPETPAVTLTFEGGFDDFYLAQADVPLEALTLQTEEVQAARWATRDEISTMLRAGTFAPYWAHFLQLLFDLHAHTGLQE